MLVVLVHIADKDTTEARLTHDLLTRLKDIEATCRVVLYSPSTISTSNARDSLPDLGSSWQVQPMNLGNKDISTNHKSELSPIVRNILIDIRKSAPNAAVVFVPPSGISGLRPVVCPTLVHEAFSSLKRGAAFVAPGDDGNCVLWGVPSAAKASALDDVKWGRANTSLQIIREFSKQALLTHQHDGAETIKPLLMYGERYIKAVLDGCPRLLTVYPSTSEFLLRRNHSDESDSPSPLELPPTSPFSQPRDPKKYTRSPESLPVVSVSSLMWLSLGIALSTFILRRHRR